MPLITAFQGKAPTWQQ